MPSAPDTDPGLMGESLVGLYTTTLLEQEGDRLCTVLGSSCTAHLPLHCWNIACNSLET